MKKIFTLLFTIALLLPISINAEETSVVTLSNCVDSESARFILGVSEIKVKFLGIQKVEINTDLLSDGIINEYVCDILKNAQEIKLEYENNSENDTNQDSLGRIQAWVFVDNNLLQEDLLKKGYAKILYLEENYKYSQNLKDAQKYAKENKEGVWHLEQKEDNQSHEEAKIEEEPKKRKNIFEIIIDFFADIISKIVDFVDGIINNILN